MSDQVRVATAGPGYWAELGDHKTPTSRSGASMADPGYDNSRPQSALDGGRSVSPIRRLGDGHQRTETNILHQVRACMHARAHVNARTNLSRTCTHIRAHNMCKLCVASSSSCRVMQVDLNIPCRRTQRHGRRSWQISAGVGHGPRIHKQKKNRKFRTDKLDT